MGLPFSLFTVADISPEEYHRFLQKMHAELLPKRAYDALIREGSGHFRIALDKGKDIEKNILIEFEDDKLHKLYALLGGKPETHMYLDVGETHGSQSLAVKFAAIIADHYPCVVLSHTSNTYYTSNDLIDLRSRGEGFDGVNWQQMEEKRRLWELEDAQEVQENVHKEAGEEATPEEHLQD